MTKVCGKDFVKVGGSFFPSAVAQRAATATGKIGLTEDGLLRGLGILKSHNPKAFTDGSTDVNTWNQYLQDTASRNIQVRSTPITSKELVGYDTNNETVARILEFINGDKYKFTEVSGQTGTLLTDDVRRFINYKRKDILENGPLMEGELDALLSELSKITDLNAVKEDLINKKEKALKKFSKGEFLDISPTDLGLIQDVLRTSIDDIIKTNTIYEMKQILDQLGAHKSSPKITGFHTLTDFAKEIVHKTNLLEERVAKAPAATFDVEAEKDMRAQKLVAEPIDSSFLKKETTREFAYNILKGVSYDSLMLLSLEQLKALENGRHNIERGRLTPTAMKAMIVLGGKNKVVKLAPLAKDATLSKFTVTNLIGSVRTLTDDFSKLGTILNTHPAYIIDQFLGNKKGTEWFDEIFHNIGRANQLFIHKLTKKIEQQDNLLLEREREVRKRTKNEKDAIDELITSNMAISLFLFKRMEESNPGETLLDTFIENIFLKSNNRQYQKNTLDLLDKHWSKVEDMNSNQMYNNFSDVEKSMIKFNDDTANEMLPMLQFTGTMHAEFPSMLNNYAYTSIMSSDGNVDQDLTQFRERFGDPGFKSPLLKTKVHGKDAILNILNPMGNVVKSAKMIYMDAYLTPEINQSLQATNDLEQMFRQSDMDASQVTESVHSLIKSFVQRDIANKLNVQAQDTTTTVARWFERAGYQVQLLSVGKVISEATSNVAHAIISRPTEFTAGVGLDVSWDRALGEELMLRRGGTDVLDKLYGENIAASAHIETNLFEAAPNKTQQASEGFIANIMNEIAARSKFKSAQTVSSKISNYAFTTPDRLIALPLFWGTFHSEFQKLAGWELTTEDYNKIKDDDNFYRENQEAIETAMDLASTAVRQSSAVREVYSGIGSLQIDPRDSDIKAVLKSINTWMQRFPMFEYASMLTGVNSVMGQGPMTPEAGAQLILGGMVRQVIYLPLMIGIRTMIANLLGGDEELDWENEFKYSLLNAAISFGVMRNLHAIPKEFLAWNLESFNKNYLSSLRDGQKYDYWEHGLTFRIMSEKDVNNNQWWKLLGPYSPVFKAITKVNNSKEPAVDATLAAAAFLNLLPFYKDINTGLFAYNKYN